MTRPEIERRLREGALRCENQGPLVMHCRGEYHNPAHCTVHLVARVAAEVEKMLGEERERLIALAGD